MRFNFKQFLWLPLSLILAGIPVQATAASGRKSTERMNAGRNAAQFVLAAEHGEHGRGGRWGRVERGRGWGRDRDRWGRGHGRDWDDYYGRRYYYPYTYNYYYPYYSPYYGYYPYPYGYTYPYRGRGFIGGYLRLY